MWPTPQDYNEAIQNPRLCFRDLDLRAASVVLNALGLPKPVTGAFASVYQLDDVRGRQFAVRCFLHNVPDQAARYAEISAELKRLALPYMVPFDFVNDGIMINGVSYPILKMQWVNGRPLIEWVARRLDYPDQLAMLASKFRTMCDALRASGIAHGDLQHGNIIVADDEIKLVDYDAMYVASLSGKHSPELGHRHYQHPHRSAKDYDATLDEFSAASIYTSLICLSIDPTLWRSLGAGDECLLFRDEDYAAPLDSVAFRLLENHASLEIQRAARAFRALCGPTRVEFGDAEPLMPTARPLPPRVWTGGRNVREAVRVELVVDEEKQVEHPQTSQIIPTVRAMHKVPVKVLPRASNAKPQRSIFLPMLALATVLPMILVVGAISAHQSYSSDYEKFYNPPVKTSTPDSDSIIERLNSADPKALADYRKYIVAVEQSMSKSCPQQIADQDLSQVAWTLSERKNYAFALRVIELKFDLIKTVRGPDALRPYIQSIALIRTLQLAAGNRLFVNDEYGRELFQKTAQTAISNQSTNPLIPIEWPAEYRTQTASTRR